MCPYLCLASLGHFCLMIFFLAQAISSSILSLIIKTVATNIAVQSFPLEQKAEPDCQCFAQTLRDWYMELCFPHEPETQPWKINEQSGASALCLLLPPPCSCCGHTRSPRPAPSAAAQACRAHASQLSGSLFLAGPRLFLLLWLEEGGKQLMGSKLGKVEKCEE